MSTYFMVGVAVVAVIIFAVFMYGQMLPTIHHIDSVFR